MRALFFFVIFFSGIYGFGQTHYFKSFDDTKIAFTDEGKGKAVLLVHGFISTKNSWDNAQLKKDLLAKGYRVIALDLRGNGDSDKPQDDDAYMQDAEVLDIMFLLLHLRLSKYMAVGYSRGSIILARLMTKDRRLTKAVLGGMGIDFTDPKWPRRTMFMNAFEGKTTEETQGAVAYAKSINADLRSLYLQQKYQPVTSRSQLNQIKIRVLVVAGDADLDNGNPVELSQSIPKSKLKIVPGDHNNTYKSADFSDAVLSFL